MSGKIIQRDGKYDNSKFVGWAEQNEVGQSYRTDHAFVNYQIPVNANKYPLGFIHGYGSSGVCWEMTPDLNNHKQDIPAINSLMDKIDYGILITHSADGYPGWVVAMENKNVKAVASFEPGGFVFSEDEVPELISSLMVTSKGIPVKADDFNKLTKIPIFLYFGDYIPEEPSKNLGDENWRVRLHMARKFVETINRHGRNATLVELPKIGIHSNTHFLMQDLNNDKIADLLNEWLIKNNLK